MELRVLPGKDGHACLLHYAPDAKAQNYLTELQNPIIQDLHATMAAPCLVYGFSAV